MYPEVFETQRWWEITWWEAAKFTVQWSAAKVSKYGAQMGSSGERSFLGRRRSSYQCHWRTLCYYSLTSRKSQNFLMDKWSENWGEGNHWRVQLSLFLLVCCSQDLFWHKYSNSVSYRHILLGFCPFAQKVISGFLFLRFKTVNRNILGFMFLFVFFPRCYSFYNAMLNSLECLETVTSERF